MYGLPENTSINQQLPKKAIYEKFSLKTSERDRFDADVSRMAIVERVSSQTLPALSAGQEIDGFYVVQVQLKRKDYSEQNIIMLTKLIPQRMIFALHFEDEVQFVVYHTRLQKSDWFSVQSAVLHITGLNLDTVWQNLVADIGSVKFEEGASLEQSIIQQEQRDKILRQIANLEKRCRSEKQTRKKYELHQQIVKLKTQIQ